jgi:DNA ligase (NAD+)
MEKDVRRVMEELIEKLSEAAKAYYVDAKEIMTNYEYDALYDRLEALEKETGIILAGSPTQKVGYEVASELPKETHPSRMLSLDKTKSREELRDWLGEREGLLSWKLDGLTVVLTYEDGALTKAVTRGNGEVGEVITANAKTFVNLPVRISHKGSLVLRGEAVITYDEFERINEEISDADAKYKNPRNLCSGSVRQLDSSITAARHVRFYAFSLVSAEGTDFERRRDEMEWLSAQGFETVEWRLVDGESVIDAVEDFEKAVEKNPVPSDGLVLTFDDIAYGQSLGTTAKAPRDSIAFKWADQTAETVLREIEWSASRTGLINPVAIFDPVELEGTTVTRASIHNVSIMEDLALGVGDTITVYKANMIIPQIAENLTKSGSAAPPKTCPVCGGKTRIKDENGVRTLWCENPECLAKQIKSFTLFVSRDAMNIEGLSEATIEKLIAKGLIKEQADILRIEEHRDAIVEMEGFGEKSFANLVASVERAKSTTPERLLYALGIPGIGVANAKIIASACGRKWRKMTALTKEELLEIDGIGDVLADGYVKFFADPEKAAGVRDIEALVTLDETEEERDDFFDGLTFVITGTLEFYENRDALKTEIEKAGGKVSGSVSSKTSYLVNNDITSTSGKNKKARELGIPVIDEKTIKSWLENKSVTA